MKKTLHNLGSLLLMVALIATGIALEAGFKAAVAHATTITPQSGRTYSLYGAGVSSTATSVTVSSLLYAGTSTPITTTHLGTTEYATLEPGHPTRQETISFTGITQNADGTATLTGVTRGLLPYYPYTTDSTLKHQHPGGTTLVLSNPPQLYNDIIAYINAAAFAGAPDASSIVKGLGELATKAEQAASTASGGSGPLVLAAQNATSTYNSATAANVVVVTGSSGKIDDNFISTTTPWASLGTAAGSFAAFNASGVFIATTSPKAAVYATSTPGTTSQTSTTTIATAPIPANTFDGTASIARVTAFVFNKTGGAANCYFDLIYGDGTASTTMLTSKANVANQATQFQAWMSASTTASQAWQTKASFANGLFNTGNSLATAQTTWGLPGFTGYDLTGKTYIAVAGRSSGGSDTCTVTGLSVESVK